MCCHDIMYFSNFLGCDTMARTELVTIGKLIETNTSNSVVYIYTHTHTHTHIHIHMYLSFSHKREGRSFRATLAFLHVAIQGLV